VFESIVIPAGPFTMAYVIGWYCSRRSAEMRTASRPWHICALALVLPNAGFDHELIIVRVPATAVMLPTP